MGVELKDGSAEYWEYKEMADFVTGSAATNLVYYLIKQMKLIF